MAATTSGAGPINKYASNMYIGTYYFRVYIAPDSDAFDGFLRVSPVIARTETVDFKHGWDKNVRKVAGRTVYEPIVLERVYQGFDEFRSWRDKIEAGQIERRDCKIEYCSPDGKPVRTLVLTQCYPIGWEMPAMDAGSSAPAVEKITLAVEAVLMTGGDRYADPSTGSKTA